MSESWGNDAGVPVPKLGALYRPAPASTPLLRASLAMDTPIPSECRWDKRLDLMGDDGQPDHLGNAGSNAVGNCVPCAALRLMQLWAQDGRKPTRERAMQLLTAWDGTADGTYTDVAFDRWGRLGWAWGDRPIVPRWTVLEADGVNVRLDDVRRAIYLLGGVLAVFQMPRSAMNTTAWLSPAGGADAEYVGDHCVLLAGYDPTAFYAVSWGCSIPVGHAFVSSRTRQISAFASDAWVHAVGDGTSRTPSGLTADQIRAIGAQIQGE